jgi:2-polyprenyl-3-methyl-5-hydroxy-6-metoxy-1,4-benzoquinol methylase
LWSEYWKTPAKEVEYNLKTEELSVRWERFEKEILKRFGSFVGLKMAEIGSGEGTYALLCARRGAHVTMIDYSEQALQRAQSLFTQVRGGATEPIFVQADALRLPPELHGQFDVTMSFGLTEHFLGEERLAINKAHIDLLRPGGVAFISVPNAHNIPYRLYMFAAKRLGRWGVGEEYPYTRKELEQICKQLRIRNYYFFGDSFLKSFSLINPVQLLRVLLKKERKPRTEKDARRDIPSILDEHYSYALVLVARKPGKVKKNV